jgi:Mn2+/Fe2+ NRAMP family transporter
MNSQPPQQDDSKPHDPPTSFWKIVGSLGPGMVIAGSIVGSGELIATTKVGATSGFWLLWVIIIGCVIKVFAQVEFGRHTIAHGETPLHALNSVPGPRAKVNWLVWCWVIMAMLIVSQQGGIVGGVGQALATGIPLTENGQIYNKAQNDKIDAKIDLAVAKMRNAEPSKLQALEQRVEQTSIITVVEPHDAKLWATLIALTTAVILYFGRYELIQIFSVVLVTGFTVITLITLGLLQTTEWAITGQELADGLSFGLPPSTEAGSPGQIGTALAAFGIIGVAASELVMYPYFCLEKGYAKATGPRDDTDSWARRATGWMRIMKIDAFTSMVIYTVSTVTFLLLGAAVLGRSGLNPEKGDMIRTLGEMYAPVFGDWAPSVFLFGAFAVLYSTFFVASAGMARLVADALGLFGFHDNQEVTRLKWTRVISSLWPLLCLIVYLWIQAPAAMILASGMAQAIMLPLLGVAVLYFRFKRSDRRLKPGKVWDAMICISCVGFLVVGIWSIYTLIENFT